MRTLRALPNSINLPCLYQLPPQFRKAVGVRVLPTDEESDAARRVSSHFLAVVGAAALLVASQLFVPAISTNHADVNYRLERGGVESRLQKMQGRNREREREREIKPGDREGKAERIW